MILYHQIRLNLINFLNKITKVVRNLASLLKFIGLYSLKMNSEWILIKLIIMNRKKCKNFWIILLEIMSQRDNWLSKRIISGNWQMILQKKKLSESISSRLKVK